MGNYMCGSCMNQQVQDEWQNLPTKVIRPDGTIEVFRKTVTAGELMKRYANHSVYHSSSMFSALTANSALPKNKELEGGRLYYVLPSHKFQATEKSSSTVKKSVPQGCGKLTVEIKSLPGFAQVTVKGRAGHMQDESTEPFISYSTPDLRSMYLSAKPQPSLARSTSWKPRLETINEVGAASRRHIQNFMRARSLRKS
uniref:Uncharacterized protein n=1 Tax=Physcomitrium patens TaxID=3218 RepID=A0A2K1JJI7_PHYPA|nr:hypothetical protein PHYPA_018889 [Physcomitrium patens]